MNDADTAEDEMRRKKLYNNRKKYPKFDKELYCLTFNEVIKGKGIHRLHIKQQTGKKPMQLWSMGCILIIKNV